MTQVSPRKLPVQQRSAATVDCILEAAAHILEREGLGGFSTNAVARRAGISIGSLYQYFPSKEAITSALVLRAHERIVEGMRGLIRDTDGQDVAAAIDAMLAMVIGGEPRSPRLSHILEAEEHRLAKTAAILAAEAEIDALNRVFFARLVDPARCDDRQLATSATEVIAIVRALLEEGARDGIEDRLRRTVIGYLAPLLPASITR